MSDEIHLNDIGTRLLCQFTDTCSPFNFTVPSSISTLTISVQGPTGDTKTFLATYASSPSLCGSTFAGDGSDGWVDYTGVSSATWDEEGDWVLQGYTAYPGGGFHSEKKEFVVYGNL